MEEKAVLLERCGPVATVTLNRPAALNSLSLELIGALAAALDTAGTDPETRVVVLAGAGKAFCAGGDLPYLEALTEPVATHRYISQAGGVIRTIMKLEKPVIAMVNGAAAGAGFNLALACDIVFAGESARFIQAFARIGLIPDCGGHFLLPRLVGLQKAKELMFTAEPLDAAGALGLGVINRVVPDAELAAATYAYANKLAAGPPVALSMMKRLLNQTFDLGLDAVLSAEADAQTLCVQTADSKEGILSFKEKRLPVFSGR